MRSLLVVILVFLVALSIPVAAQQDNRRGGADRAAAAPAEQPRGQPKDSARDRKDKAPANPEAEKPPVVPPHEIHSGGQVLRSPATAGLMPINDEAGKVDAHIFYIAYTLENPSARRPLTFSFNGGPGSASVWLHIGAIG